MSNQDLFFQGLDYLCIALIRGLEEIEYVQRRLYPPDIPRLGKNLEPIAASLNEAFENFRLAAVPDVHPDLLTSLEKSVVCVIEALQRIIASGTSDMETGVVQVLKAFRTCSRTQELLFELRRAIPRLNPFFLEPQAQERVAELDPAPPPRSDTGLHHSGTDTAPYARGAYSLYVPESYEGVQPWPLVIVLHGGFGHGRDFIWTWLREARSRRFVLLAPSSSASTWSLLSPQIDGSVLRAVYDEVTSRWNIDPERVLLTGISDGGTFALEIAAEPDSPFSAFAVIACTLPPVDFQMMRGKRIYWIHGALDWMFPVGRAKRDAAMLSKLGIDMTFRVIKDLSHTYPRDENDGILRWFDPGLACK